MQDYLSTYLSIYLSTYLSIYIAILCRARMTPCNWKGLRPHPLINVTHNHNVTINALSNQFQQLNGPRTPEKWMPYEVRVLFSKPIDVKSSPSIRPSLATAHSSAVREESGTETTSGHRSSLIRWQDRSQSMTVSSN